MDDLTRGGRDPANDAVEHYLTVLPAFSPTPGFAERILLRVWRPVPRWLTEIRTRLFTPARVRLTIGILAAGSFLWQTTLAGLIVSRPGEAGAVAGWLTAEAWPLVWGAAQAYLDTVTEPAAAAAAALLAGGSAVAAAAASSVAVVAGCAWGLYRTAGPARGRRVTS